MKNLRLKSVFRFDPTAKLVRLFRVMWESGRVGDGTGYSSKLSLGLSPTLFRLRRDFNGCAVTVLGVRLHWQRDFGGIFA